MHYYKFNIADWHLATSHLSLEEEAIYFKLVNFYYDTESPIPLETQSVIRRLRLGMHSDSVRLVLEEFFIKTENGYIHDRCDMEIKKYHKKADINKMVGKLGGRPKKINDLQNNPQETQMVSKNNPQETLTTNQKPVNNIYSPNFELFWNAYPEKKGKGGAWASWKKINPNEELLGKILKSIDFYKESKRVKDGFIKNPQTWLNQRCWEDEDANFVDKSNLAPEWRV